MICSVPYHSNLCWSCWCWIDHVDWRLNFLKPALDVVVCAVHNCNWQELYAKTALFFVVHSCTIDRLLSVALCWKNDNMQINIKFKSSRVEWIFRHCMRLRVRLRVTEWEWDWDSAQKMTKSQVVSTPPPPPQKWFLYKLFACIFYPLPSQSGKPAHDMRGAPPQEGGPPHEPPQSPSRVTPGPPSWGVFTLLSNITPKWKKIENLLKVKHCHKASHVHYSHTKIQKNLSRLSLAIHNLKHDIKPIMREQWIEPRLQRVAPDATALHATDVALAWSWTRLISDGFSFVNFSAMNLQKRTQNI